MNKRNNTPPTPSQEGNKRGGITPPVQGVGRKEGWVISNIEESKDISFKAEGYLCVVRLDGLSEEGLKDLKRLIFKVLDNVLAQRDQIYECIRRINGELDRRVNEKACK